MATINAQPIPTGSRTNGEVATGCSVCAHPWTAHDQIATRFCNATVAGGHNRGCVCTVHPSNRVGKQDQPNTS